MGAEMFQDPKTLGEKIRTPHKQRGQALAELAEKTH